MEIERVISWFDKKSGEFIDEYKIDPFLNLDQLRGIFQPYDKDEEMHMVYDIEAQQAKELRKYFEFDFNFEKYKYQLDCFQAGT